MFKIFMIGYLSFRFCWTLLKPHYTFSFGLSTLQMFVLLVWFIIIDTFIRQKKLVLT